MARDQSAIFVGRLARFEIAAIKILDKGTGLV
jgi:hypothetical protein